VAEPLPTGDIEVRALTRLFGELRAVDNVDLTVPAGQIFAFLGPNGAGKSTVVKILTTILAPTAGTARVAGYDVTREGARVRRAIGVALQEVGLDPLMTARELLVLQAQLFGSSAGAARLTADRLLTLVDLADVATDKRSGEYSGGMKRRLDLALALVHDPRILFLDEPTTGLDPASRMAIWDEVRRLNQEKGMTIFLTTQYLEEADRLAEQVAIINHGRIVARGTPAELKKGLGDEVVELTLTAPDVAAHADAALASLTANRQLNGRKLRLYFTDAANALPEVVRRLDAAQISFSGLTVSQPTLDDVFLRVTGEFLGSQEPADEHGPGVTSAAADGFAAAAASEKVSV
jgi:ABC-2 type transport system ATP-binding protein